MAAAPEVAPATVACDDPGPRLGFGPVILAPLLLSHSAALAGPCKAAGLNGKGARSSGPASAAPRRNCCPLGTPVLRPVAGATPVSVGVTGRVAKPSK